MKPAVGIMQGRLLPPFEGRFQAFPAERWREEFPRAAQAGLACIEWIYEKPHEDANPVRTDEGIREIRHLTEKTGVGVRSICADYYMTERLVDEGGRPSETSREHLNWLIGRAKVLGAAYIVLPFVDRSSLKTQAEIEAAAAVLTDAAARAQDVAVELHIECDLPPTGFRLFLEDIGHPMVKANYDIGNSASLGFDPAEELSKLGPYLGSVHVKDRKLGGGTVPLGTGNADFATCFRLIRRAGFARWFVLQAAREEQRPEAELAAANREFVERQWAQAA
jgi:hexulose-6-phosphate isomerase